MKRAKRLWNLLSLGAIMAFLAACHKDPTPNPQPTPDQPTDTITPIIPTKEIIIHWDWDAGIGWAPPKDSIKYYANQDSVKTIFIHPIGRDGIGFPVNYTGVYAGSLHRARDTLQTRIDIDSTKVALAGAISVSNTNLPNHDPGQEPGIAWYDREWFERHGCRILPAYSK